MNNRTVVIVCIMGLSLGLVGAKWARVQNEEVQEVWNERPDFHPQIMAQIVSAPDNVTPEWRKQGDNWLPPKTQEERERDRFDRQRVRLLAKNSAVARREMMDTYMYKLTGPLESGYPDPAQPLCTNAVGVAMTPNDMLDYIQGMDDAGATNPEMQPFKQQVKAARLYFKTLKGD